MYDRETTVRSRELGCALSEAMTDAQLNASQVADQLGWSPTKVSRLVNGKRGGTPVDVASFLAICRVTGAERVRLLGLCEEVKEEGWWQRYGERLPKQLRTLIAHENKAIGVGAFEPTAVPGLLQTGNYARALATETGNVPSDEIEERVHARLARKSLFDREHPPKFAFFVHEFVLRLPVGGPEVMSDQLHELLRMSVRANLTLRVVPAAIGGHAGIAGGFTMMEFADFKPVIYLDSETSCLFLEKHVEANAYRRILANLAHTALDERQSREVIAHLATDLYGERDGHDEDQRAGRDRLADQ